MRHKLKHGCRIALHRLGGAARPDRADRALYLVGSLMTFRAADSDHQQFATVRGAGRIESNPRSAPRTSAAQRPAAGVDRGAFGERQPIRSTAPDANCIITAPGRGGDRSPDNPDVALAGHRGAAGVERTAGCGARLRAAQKQQELRGGRRLCFPSVWSLIEKFGQSRWIRCSAAGSPGQTAQVAGDGPTKLSAALRATWTVQQPVAGVQLPAGPWWRTSGRMNRPAVASDFQWSLARPRLHPRPNLRPRRFAGLDGRQ